ncbi:helix-turn-helix domain-containing protein [Microbacterium rhizophilus]|uniref:helix-turn-helix domain-containing protein n=1 Tax=Microbacterium rhizophilus TaxID=3138934 RepID=UPI0031F01CA2
MDRARITDPRILGLTLREARVRAGLTQEELAERLEISQRYIWELESGKNAKVLVRILELLDEVGAVMYVDVPDEAAHRG